MASADRIHGLPTNQPAQEIAAHVFGLERIRLYSMDNDGRASADIYAFSLKSDLAVGRVLPSHGKASYS